MVTAGGLFQNIKTYNNRQVRSLMISIDEQNTEVNIKLEETNLNPKYSSE